MDFDCPYPYENFSYLNERDKYIKIWDNVNSVDKVYWIGEKIFELYLVKRDEIYNSHTPLRCFVRLRQHQFIYRARLIAIDRIKPVNKGIIYPRFKAGHLFQLTDVALKIRNPFINILILQGN